jgi:hypothetical protein
VRGPGHAGDPFLVAVDDVVFSVFGLDSGGENVGYI